MLPNKTKKNRLNCISHPLVAIVCIFILFYYGCSSQEDNKEAKETNETGSLEPVRPGGTYHYPLMNNPKTLDPAYVNDWYGETIVHQLFEGLVQFGPDLTVLPALAESWKVEEKGKVYRFFLRENAFFHSGRHVTTHDVIFTIRRLLRVNPAPAILPHLLKIEGAQDFQNQGINDVTGLHFISDHELLIRLTEPHVPFLTALGMYQASIVPRPTTPQEKKSIGRYPIGSGPFKFVSWIPDESIRLERFSDYYAGAAFLDEIQYRIYPGGQINRVLSDFKAGSLKEMPVYGSFRHELSGEKKYQWFHRPSLSLLFYGMKSGHVLLNNSDFRMALSLAIDRKKLVEQVYNGQFEPARSILPPGMPVQNKLEVRVADNMPSARKYLKKALKDNTVTAPPRIEIVSGSKSVFAIKELDYVRTRWKQLGVQVETKFITDWSKFIEYLKSDSVQIYRYAWFADIPDPDSFLYPLFASDSPVNFTGFRNDRVDRMLIDARRIIDPVKRAEMYQQIEKIILKSCPAIPLFYLSIDRVYQPDVQGVQISALGAHTMSLYRIWLKAQPHP